MALKGKVKVITMSTIIAIVVEKYHMMVRVTEVIMIAKALDVGNVMIVMQMMLLRILTEGGMFSPKCMNFRKISEVGGYFPI